jgi:hypothetical protein
VSNLNLIFILKQPHRQLRLAFALPEDAMADARPMRTFHSLQHTSQPVVLVHATRDAEVLCLKNGLTAADLFR